VKTFRRVGQLLPARVRSRIRQAAAARILGPEAALLREHQARLEPTLDWVLSDYRQRCPHVRFMQVGANDGVMNDPIFPLIKKHSLQGVLIEPQRDSFNLLKKNYTAFAVSDFVFVNAAIAASDGSLPLYRIRAEPHVPTWAFGLASFDKNVLRSHAAWSEAPADLESLIDIEQVRTISFASLFNEYSIGHIHLLQIDTEGYDAEVIRLFDISSRKPAIVRFEHKHLSWRDFESCMKLLISERYKISISATDTLAYNSEY